jgi:hypothetical protein
MGYPFRAHTTHNSKKIRNFNLNHEVFSTRAVRLHSLEIMKIIHQMSFTKLLREAFIARSVGNQTTTNNPLAARLPVLEISCGTSAA